MKKIIAIAAALAVCAALFATREKPPECRTEPVKIRTISRRVEAVGTVNYETVCALTPQTAGSVRRVFVREGQRVGRGQAVAEMELLAQDAAAYLAKLQNVDMDPQQIREEMLKMCTVTAPQDGVVTGLSVWEGMPAAPGAALGSVCSDVLCITALIPESVREEVEVGQEVSVKRGENEITAQISSILPSAEANGQYCVRIESPCGFSALVAGMKADVEICIDEKSGPSIPLQALCADGTVKCRTEEGFAAIPVRTGLCDETHALLISGPPLGTEVVVEEEE